MPKEDSEEKKLIDRGTNFYLILMYFSILLLIIIWLFTLLNNSKNEPSNWNIYIRKDPSNYYEEGEFCYDNYENFIIKGALNNFDISTKHIKIHARATLGTIFISIGSIIIASIFKCIAININNNKARYNKLKNCFFIIFIIAFILTIGFSTALVNYCFKGNYNDFEEFSRCRYLTKNFKSDYNFVLKIKNGFNLPFFLILFIEICNFIKLISEAIELNR